MGMIKIIWSFLSVSNKLLQIFQKWNTRTQVRRTYHNEKIAKQLEKLRRAVKVRRDIRNRAGKHPNKRMQNDGYRRD